MAVVAGCTNAVNAVLPLLGHFGSWDMPFGVRLLYMRSTCTRSVVNLNGGDASFMLKLCASHAPPSSRHQLHHSGIVHE